MLNIFGPTTCYARENPLKRECSSSSKTFKKVQTRAECISFFSSSSWNTLPFGRSFAALEPPRRIQKVGRKLPLQCRSKFATRLGLGPDGKVLAASCNIRSCQQQQPVCKFCIGLLCKMVGLSLLTFGIKWTLCKYLFLNFRENLQINLNVFYCAVTSYKNIKVGYLLSIPVWMHLEMNSKSTVWWFTI